MLSVSGLLAHQLLPCTYSCGVRCLSSAPAQVTDSVLPPQMSLVWICFCFQWACLLRPALDQVAGLLILWRSAVYCHVFNEIDCIYSCCDIVFVFWQINLARRPEIKLKPLEFRQWCYTTLIPGSERQSQEDLCELKATLGYTRSVQKQIRVVVTYTFNPNAFNPMPLITALKGL